MAESGMFRSLVNKFSDLKCAVFGDFMLDQYIYGDVCRISPEAPVPVVKYLDEKWISGGAGNVVANLSGLGVSVRTFGLVGDDEYGELLLARTQMKTADNSFILRQNGTIVKTRVLGSGRQQMLRIDRENATFLSRDQVSKIVNNFTNTIAGGLDCVVISDYGKGFCSPELCRIIIELCRCHGVKVFVDPKSRDWSHYTGAFLITPNTQELSLAAGENIPNEDEPVVAAGKTLLQQYDIANLLVTRSDKGATLISRSGYTHCPAESVEVFDVSGAGDTMIASMAAFSSAGCPLDECVRIANTASQIVIGKVGTYPVTAKELLEALSGGDVPRNHKIVDKITAKKICEDWVSEGQRVIFTNGCFDILHVGHIDSLQQAKKLGDRLIVGLNSDDSVRLLKGDGRPVNSQAARASVLAALESVDMIVIFDEDTPAALISQLRPNVIAKGGDYTPQAVAGREFVDEVVILPLVKGFSTTKIIEKTRCHD